MHDPYWQYFEYLRYEIEKLHKEQEAIRRQISEIKPVHVTSKN
jgi:hypothetical protein